MIKPTEGFKRIPAWLIYFPTVCAVVILCIIFSIIWFFTLGNANYFKVAGTIIDWHTKQLGWK